MDLNQLYFDHQVLLMQSSTAGSDELRLRLGYRASTVASSIERMNRASGAPPLRHWKGRGSSQLLRPDVRTQAA